MNLDNLVETVVHYLLIGGMTYLDRWDEFLIVSALVYGYTLMNMTYNGS